MAQGSSPSRRAPAAAAPRSPRRTQKERSEQAEQAILDAASTLFALRGVDRTSMADICSAAGYSNGLASHHFGSKAALVEALAKRFQHHFVADFQSHSSSTDTIEVLADLVERYVGGVGRTVETSRAFFVMWGASLPAEAPLRPVFTTDDADFRTAVEMMLRQGQNNGSVDACVDPEAGAVAMVALLRGVATQYLIDPSKIDLPATVLTLQQFVRRSFTAS